MDRLVMEMDGQLSNLRRNRHRVFRDRTHPFDAYDDVDFYDRYRFRRHDVIDITNELGDRIEMANRGHTVPPSLQVCVALRFYASGSFQTVCGDTVGLSQPTICRAVHRVTDALMTELPNWIVFPDQREANQQMLKFFDAGELRCPNVFGCIDGTLIKIQRPRENEDHYVDRKNNHSLNVQVVCNADLVFIDVYARWPGRVHDARVLRQSALFQAFESDDRPLEGILLGDSSYMMRDWLFTPIPIPQNSQEECYNTAHKTTHNMVERTIGVAKRRWHCLRGMRLEPAKACRVIMVCFMLHNRARALNLPELDADDDVDVDEADENRVLDADDDVDVDEADENRVEQHIDDVQNPLGERARVAAGKAARNRFVTRFF